MTIFKAATAAMLLAATPAFAAQDHPMGFFVTSVGSGDGANLGGLDGADAHCAKLAEAAGSEGRTWRAYLSTQEEGKRGVSARDRIGLGPWYNAVGVLIASDLDQLHINPNIVMRRRWMIMASASTDAGISRTGMIFSPVQWLTAPRISRV